MSDMRGGKMDDGSHEHERTYPARPEQPVGGWGEGMAARRLLDRAGRIGRFSDGLDRRVAAYRALRFGRFSDGQERRPDRTGSRERRFSEGLAGRSPHRES
jgi:hypothetical protein